MPGSQTAALIPLKLSTVDSDAPQWIRTSQHLRNSQVEPPACFGSYTRSEGNDVMGGEVVRWEILSGLPGEGPAPMYFHSQHPTPWAEGLVVRFWRADGSQWVGNFQGKQDWSTKVLPWPEADSIIVIAMDNFYLLDAGNPVNYVTAGSELLIDDVMFDDDRNALFVAANTTILAFGRNRQLIWRRDSLREFDAQFRRSANGILSVDVEEELGGERKILHLSVNDGALL